MRRHGITTALAILCLVGGSAPASIGPGPEVRADGEAHVQLAAWAFDRFAGTDLELPRVEVHFHETPGRLWRERRQLRSVAEDHQHL